MRRLSRGTLDALPPDIERPRYDRDAVKTGVVHLGIGAFHRAHQAVLFDDALASGDARWGVVGVSLRSAAVRERLADQDGLYSLVVRDGAEEQVRVIGAIRGILVAPEDPRAVIAALASADAHIVTLTITEKGYRLAGGRLDKADPDVAHDLARPDAPRTAPGFLVAGLAARREAGLPPFTAISCDNLPHNGRLLRDAVLEMARARDPALAEWIAEEGAFPQTMVDRIVPATSSEDVAALSHRLGVEDQAMVKTEPFLQWVIEDRFCGPRPDFAKLGAQLTNDVAPWEEAKLRLLNGAHSAIAYLGGLAGIAFVHEVVALPEARRFVEALWGEAAATLDPPPGLDIPAYRQALMARFANPALQHRARQIAMDGSQKLPQRLLAPMAERRARGLPVEALALAVAAWMRWQAEVDDRSQPFAIDDPLAGEMADRLRGCAAPAERVEALMGMAFFPPPLARDETLRRRLADSLAALETEGALAALARFAPPPLV